MKIISQRHTLLKKNMMEELIVDPTDQNPNDLYPYIDVNTHLIFGAVVEVYSKSELESSRTFEKRTTYSHIIKSLIGKGGPENRNTATLLSFESRKMKEIGMWAFARFWFWESLFVDDERIIYFRLGDTEQNDYFVEGKFVYVPITHAYHSLVGVSNEKIYASLDDPSPYNVSHENDELEWILDRLFRNPPEKMSEGRLTKGARR